MNLTFELGGANELKLKTWRRQRILPSNFAALTNFRLKLGGANEFDLKTWRRQRVRPKNLASQTNLTLKLLAPTNLT